MNIRNLHQIFKNYIDNFEVMNDSENNETFKWEASYQFRRLMDDAFHSDSNGFIQKMNQIKTDGIVRTIIDGRMRPFAGLAQLATEYDAEAVRTLFQDLFANDGGDLTKREQKISAFLQGCEELRLAKFPNYYSYKQTARSVAGYLFLYNPEQYYMYKATEAHRFANDIEFYGDWGSGDHLKLKEYYRLCNELVTEIKKCPELVHTHNNRFKHNLDYAEDRNLHILAYDIIYCTCAYDLDRNITFRKVSLKEKKLYQERMKKALTAQEHYAHAEKEYRLLEQAIQHYDSVFSIGTVVQHKSYGTGTILDRYSEAIIIQFEAFSEPFKCDFYAAVANHILNYRDSLEIETEELYQDLFSRHSGIRSALETAQHKLIEYRDFLE